MLGKRESGSVAVGKKTDVNVQNDASTARDDELTKGKVLLVIGDAAEVTDTLYPWMREFVRLLEKQESTGQSI